MIGTTQSLKLFSPSNPLNRYPNVLSRGRNNMTGYLLFCVIIIYKLIYIKNVTILLPNNDEFYGSRVLIWIRRSIKPFTLINQTYQIPVYIFCLVKFLLMIMHRSMNTL